MVTEVGAENSSTTVLMIPSDFVSLSKSLTEFLRERAGQRSVFQAVAVSSSRQ